MTVLYSYWRSSAAYRIRIALNLKNIDFQTRAVNLAQGKQFDNSYRDINSQALVPCLVDGDIKITQSQAILEYLEEQYPQPSLLPEAKSDRALVRALCQIIACDIHPLNNLRVLKYNKRLFNGTDEQQAIWYHHWLRMGFEALEAMIKQGDYQQQFCFGKNPTLADCFLIPQLYNARRFNFPLDDFPVLMQIDTHCQTLNPFLRSLPENQPDAE